MKPRSLTKLKFQKMCKFTFCSLFAADRREIHGINLQNVSCINAAQHGNKASDVTLTTTVIYLSQLLPRFVERSVLVCSCKRENKSIFEIKLQLL